MCDERLFKLGQRIQRLRQELGLSQEKFAKLIKRTPAHLSKIERGVKTPSIELLLVIADNLQVPVGDLFKEVLGKERSNVKAIKERLDALLSVTSYEKARLILKVAQQIHASE